MKSKKLENKIALVTGGSAGIGLSICKTLSDNGAKIIIADIDDKNGVKEAKKLKGFFIKLDASSEESWQGLMKTIRTEFKKLDILVNNAGILGHGIQDPENTDLSLWKKVHSINLDSVFLGCKYGIKLMKKNGGSIINMSSRSGIVGVPNACAYASSKAGVRNHTKSVALYCASQKYNIRCNSIHPASILTQMWKSMLSANGDYKANLSKFSKDIPLGRFGTPEEVAKAVLFLASDDSSYMTGSELAVDGGILAGTITSPDTNLK